MNINEQATGRLGGRDAAKGSRPLRTGGSGIEGDVFIHLLQASS